MPDLGHLTLGANKGAAPLHRWIYGMCPVSTVIFRILKSALIPKAPRASIPTCPPRSGTVRRKPLLRSLGIDHEIIKKPNIIFYKYFNVGFFTMSSFIVV